MKSMANSVEEYLNNLPSDRHDAVSRIRKIINENLPEGFEETMSYGMIGWVVPHSRYPGGYHCDPKLPLPFINLASQKNHVALYHSGMYADKDLYTWFVDNYTKQASRKLDMGKSCVRFKHLDDIPYGIIEELARKMSVDDWIRCYEEALNAPRQKRK